MRVFIDYGFTPGPWGGANQFLGGLQKFLGEEGYLARSLDEAQVVLVNGHNLHTSISRLRAWKVSDTRRRIVHRVDGPLRLVRGQLKQGERDELVFSFNQALADGTIFQSAWSMARTEELGHRYVRPATQILNAPNGEIFYPRAASPEGKVGILIASWSTNVKKGFATYKLLDQEFDQSRFQVTFVGQSLTRFDHIVDLGPLSPLDLAHVARRNEIFLSASEDDPCSNALIEAIHCGLVPLALESGGNTEIVSDATLRFDNFAGLLEGLESAARLSREKSFQHTLPGLMEVGRMYLDFFEKVVDEKQRPVSELVTLKLHWEYLRNSI